MRFPLFSLTRRQALTSVAAAATATANAGQASAATLVTLKKNSEKELLHKIAVTRDNVFALWSTAIARGSSRIACYGLNGDPQWSEDFGFVPVFDIVATGDHEVSVVVLDRQAFRVTFSKYNTSGALNLTDSLPVNEAVLAVAASPTHICALDLGTALVAKQFGAAGEPTRRPPVFDTPTIGGLKPRAIIASMHFLDTQLVLLDHVKARTATIFSNGALRSGRVVHAPIEEAIQKQDSDVLSRATVLRATGNEHTVTFPTSISFAASDRVNTLWITSSLGTRIVPLVRLDSTLGVSATYNIQVPDDPILKGRPPLMLSASQSTLALGFREGAVALIDTRGIV